MEKKKENSQIELWIWRIVTPVLSILIISFTFIWHISKQIVEKASQLKMMNSKTWDTDSNKNSNIVILWD